MSAPANRQQRYEWFVQEYLKDFNITQAAIRMGYPRKNAYRRGYELMKVPWVRGAIEDAKLEAARKARLSVGLVLEELARVAFCDLRTLFDREGRLLPLTEMPEDARRAISAIEVEEREDGVRVRRIRTANKLEALALLGRHLGMFKERVELAQITTIEAARLLLDEYDNAHAV